MEEELEHVSNNGSLSWSQAKRHRDKHWTTTSKSVSDETATESRRPGVRRNEPIPGDNKEEDEEEEEKEEEADDDDDLLQDGDEEGIHEPDLRRGQQDRRRASRTSAGSDPSPQSAPKAKAKANKDKKKKKKKNDQQRVPRVGTERRLNRARRAATARKERVWDYGVIPYEIDANFSGAHKALFKQAQTYYLTTYSIRCNNYN